MKEDLTVEDIVAEAADASYHTLLEIWDAVLTPAASERTKRPTAQWANTITSRYREIDFKDMLDFSESYFDKVQELQQILRHHIEEDDEALKQPTPEEDLEYNGARYKQLLIDWQKAFLLWELAWDCTDASAAIDIAAISEVHKMFFDQQGLIALLEQINFEFTEQDQAELAAELQALKDQDE